MLLFELRRGVQQLEIPLEDMLRLLTTSPAKRLGKEGVKGCIAPGADADLLVMDKELQITDVFARGKRAMAGGELRMKGTFEA